MTGEPARALDARGEGWPLLIARGPFLAPRRFSDFEKSLGIAKNILSNRLARLVEHEIFAKVDAEYRLTPKGEALLPLLTALRDWSDEWIFGRGAEPVIVQDRRTNRRLPKLRVTDADGNELTRRELRTIAGPGASEATRRLFERR